jgi:hypothetical protein
MKKNELENLTFGTQRAMVDTNRKENGSTALVKTAPGSREPAKYGTVRKEPGSTWAGPGHTISSPAAQPTCLPFEILRASVVVPGLWRCGVRLDRITVYQTL